MSNPEIILSKKEARKLLLHHQGLWPPRQMSSKADILKHFKKVGCIQYDPLNILGRNPDLVLQSRVKNYSPEMLRELLYEDRQLLDGWDKLMAIYSVNDWPYFARYRAAQKEKYSQHSEDLNNTLPIVRDEIRERGPLSSLDLKFDQKVNWSWNPTRVSRAALDSMFFMGELIVHHKVNTRKVYDFAENHIPEEIFNTQDPNKTMQDYRDWHVLRRIGSIGLVSSRSREFWLGILDTKSSERNQSIKRLIEQEKVTSVKIAELPNMQFYSRKEDIDAFLGLPDPQAHNQAAVIAALDNLTWDRQQLRDIFDFDYLWEVYKPINDRRYGYYVLPVLFNDRFIARFEAKLDKKNKSLSLINWWWENDSSAKDQKIIQALQKCFEQFNSYLAVKEILFDPNSGHQEKFTWYPGI